MNVMRPFVVFFAVAAVASMLCNAACASEVKYHTDFESPADTAAWRAAGNATVSTDQAHSGKASLQITRSLDSQEACWTSPDIPVKQGSPYRFSIWMKSSKVFMPDPSFAPEVHAVFFNAIYAQAGDVPIADYFKVDKDAGAVGLTTFSFDWKYFEKVVVAPSSAIGVRLVFKFSKTTGTAWIDDPQVTFDPDAATQSGGAGEAGFLRVWPTRVPSGGIRSADSTIFNPGEPMDFTVAAPEGNTPSSPQEVHWTLKDALQRTLFTGKQAAATGSTVQIHLPNLDVQEGRWIECDWDWRQDGKTIAKRITSVGVVPAAGFTTPGIFGSTGNPDQLSFTKRLGATILREDIFWRDDIQSSEDAPVVWKGLFDQRMTAPKSYGEQVEANLSWCCPKWAYLHPDELHDQSVGFPSRPDALQKATFSTVQQYKGSVQYWQLGNEINLHDKASRDDYFLDLKAFSAGVRAADPNAKVILGSQNRGVGDIQTAIDEGVLNFIDIVDCHYFDPESLAQVRAILDKASPNRHIAIWQTEVGIFSQDTDDVYANTLVKTFTTNAAAGVENIVWCYLGGVPSLSEREEDTPDKLGGEYLAPRSEMPGQLYFAHYLMASEIQGAKFVKEYDFGPRGCGYLFRSGDRNVLIAWANGLSGIDGVLTTGASTIEIADWTGRRASIEAAGRPIAARLSVRPAFYAWKGPDPSSILSFERDPTLKVATDRDRVLYSGTANTVTITANQNARKAMNLDIDAGPGVVVSPASITLKPGESRDVTVTIPPDLAATRVTIDIRQTDGKALGGWTSYEYNIKPSVSVSIDQVPLVNRLGSSERPAWKVIVSNGGAQPTSVMLSLDSLATNGPVPDHSVATVRLAKGQSKVLTFPLSSTPSYSRVYDLNYIAQVAGRNVIAGSATHGFLGIAHLAKPFRIDADLSKWSSFRPAAVTGDENYFRFRNDGVPWGGPADLSAKLYFAWDKDALYVAADVSDDIHVNTKDPHDSYIWDGDSLEFALQPVTSDGYGPIVKSIFALASGEPAVMFSPSSPGCKPSAATVKVRRVTGHTLYEAQLPWKAIYPDVAEVHVGSCFRVAALLNEDDHGAREAYMTWFGLLCWPTLGAGEFTDMVLCN